MTTTTDKFIEIRDNCDGTWTVSDPTGEYDDVTTKSEFDAEDHAIEMADATGLEIKRA